jgi:hypothetical protein
MPTDGRRVGSPLGNAICMEVKVFQRHVSLVSKSLKIEKLLSMVRRWR